MITHSACIISWPIQPLHARNMTSLRTPTFVAEGLLARIKANGIDYIFANAGTDFTPIIVIRQAMTPYFCQVELSSLI